MQLNSERVLPRRPGVGKAKGSRYTNIGNYGKNRFHEIELNDKRELTESKKMTICIARQADVLTLQYDDRSMMRPEIPYKLNCQKLGTRRILKLEVILFI